MIPYHFPSISETGILVNHWQYTDRPKCKYRATTGPWQSILCMSTLLNTKQWSGCAYFTTIATTVAQFPWLFPLIFFQFPWLFPLIFSNFPDFPRSLLPISLTPRSFLPIPWLFPLIFFQISLTYSWPMLNSLTFPVFPGGWSPCIMHMHTFYAHILRNLRSHITTVISYIQWIFYNEHCARLTMGIARKQTERAS